MNAQIKKYVKERDKMLKKCDVNELRKFVNTHKHFYSEKFLRAINAASDDLLKVVLHKMIVNAIKLPHKMRTRSAIWLVAQGYDININ